jgi:hypothetical protein
MALSTRLIFDKKFHNWYLEQMITFKRVGEGVGREACIVALQDSFNKEMNTLKFILEGLYPNSYMKGDKPLFITDPMEHELFYDLNHPNEKGKIEGLFFPGRMHLWFEKHDPRIIFPDEPAFKHGHIHKAGYIECWGGYQHCEKVGSKYGLTAVLTEMFNFASKSRYHTTYNGVHMPQQVKA